MLFSGLTNNKHLEASLRSSPFLLEYVFFHCVPGIILPLTAPKLPFSTLVEFETPSSSQILQSNYAYIVHRHAQSWPHNCRSYTNCLMCKNLRTEWWLNTFSFSRNHFMLFCPFPTAPTLPNCRCAFSMNTISHS